MPRPVGAGILTILGSIFVMLGGLGFALLGAVFAAFGLASSFFLAGLAVGILLFFMGLLMLAAPSGHAVWGVITVVLALVSVVVAFAGFIIGFLLVFIGGILAIVWKPAKMPFIDVAARKV